MTRITVLGGTGYAGSHIAREAATRGHDVTVVSRHAPTDPIDGVTYATADVTDDAALASVVDGAEVVIEALSPRAELVGALPAIVTSLASLAAASGARLGIIGGFGSLRVAEGGPRIADGDAMPAEYVGESREMAEALGWLQQSAPEGLDWFYVSPAASFGAHTPGERTGTYSFGGEVVTNFDTAISGADFGIAVVDELEKHELAGHISVFS
jgi:putative NADH-flavin reductase